MVEWKSIKDLFDYEKGTLQSTKATQGKYVFVTAAEEWKTHNEYTHDEEALIFAMAASGSLGRTHYVKGKFITSDLCFVLTPKRKHDLDLKFYYFLFNFLKMDIVNKTKSGTSKLAINKRNFGEYKLPYFDYEHQIKYKEKLNRIATEKEEYGNQIEEQQKIIIQLRKMVLQSAIEGKLTFNWRLSNKELISGINHVSNSLEKLKMEKEELVRKRAIKKEATQEPNYSFPMTVPDEWALCKMIDLSKQITDGTHQTPTYVENGKIFLSAQNVKPFRFIPEIHRFIGQKAFDDNRKNRVPELGDILIARVGAGIGEAAVIDKKIDFAFYVSLGLIKL